MRLQVDNEDLIGPMYAAMAQVEATFSFHQAESELSRYNRDPKIETTEEFRALLTLAQNLRKASEGAFDPFVEGALDLGGIAKGWAVDRAIERALQLDPEAKGYVEAGGDIRFFGETEARVALRLGIPPNVVLREIEISGLQMAVASSSPGMAKEYGESKTRLRQGQWPEGTSVSVAASNCALADALTKVVLFGERGAWKKIDPLARVFVFDRHGELQEGI